MRGNFIAKRHSNWGWGEDEVFETEEARKYWMRGFMEGCNEGRADGSYVVELEEYKANPEDYED